MTRPLRRGGSPRILPFLSGRGGSRGALAGEAVNSIGTLPARPLARTPKRSTARTGP